MAEKKTIHYFEWARAFGALAVVCLHAVVSYFNLVDVPGVYDTFWAPETLVTIPFTRWAVPVFFMISGALLLDPKREMPPKKLARHIWRITFVLGTIGYVFCLIEGFYSSWAITPELFAQSAINLLTGNSWGHLWYLYSLLGLYVVTPPLRWIVRRARRAQLATLILLLYAVLCGYATLSIMELAPTVTTQPWAFILYQCFPVVYYLAGYYAHQHLKLTPGVILAGLVGLGLMCATLVADLPGGGELMLPEYCFVLPFSLLVFVLLKLWSDTPIESSRIVRTVSGYSFGIYILHPLFQHVLFRIIDARMIPIFLEQAIVAAISLFGSVLLTKALRAVPCYRDKL